MLILLAFLSLLNTSALGKETPQKSTPLRTRAESEIQIPTNKKSPAGDQLATVNAPLPALAKPEGAGGSVSLLFTNQVLQGQSRYINAGNFDLGQLPASPGVNLNLEKEFSILPLSLWAGVFYSSHRVDHLSPLLESDPINVNTLAIDIGPGYRINLFGTTSVNFHVSYGRYWLMQNSSTGLGNESANIDYIGSQVQVEVASLWNSPWRPIIGVQKRWQLTGNTIGVADPRLFLGLMYREAK